MQQQTEGSFGLGSDGDCGCPTGRSVPSKSPPPPGWDETWQSPQILRETEEGERERRGEDKIAESLHIILVHIIFWEHFWKIYIIMNRPNEEHDERQKSFHQMKWGDKTADSEERAKTKKDMKQKQQR